MQLCVQKLPAALPSRCHAEPLLLLPARRHLFGPADPEAWWVQSTGKMNHMTQALLPTCGPEDGFGL